MAYVVLAISTVFDLVSIRQSAGQMARRARRYDREFLEESRVTSDPSLRAVFVEDAVSIGGDVLAFAALALNQVTGSSILQGVPGVDCRPGCRRRWPFRCASPVGAVVGDLLVQPASAHGRRGSRQHIPFPVHLGRGLGAMHHFDLLNHPDVWAAIRGLLERAQADSI